MIAVWGGKPPASPGGIGDIVAYARRLGRPVTHIDPGTRHSASSGNDNPEHSGGASRSSPVSNGPW
jgi:hypothetical protein